MVQSLVLAICPGFDASSQASNTAIVHQTVQVCHEQIKSATFSSCSTTVNTIGSHYKENGESSYVTLQVFLAGSKRLMQDTPGKKRPDWQTQWSSGEFHFGKIVEGVGLDKFTPPGFGGNHTNCQVKATLLGMDEDDLDSNNSNNNGDTSRDGNLLERDLRQAALMCQETLQRQRSPPIARATIVVPLNVSNMESEAERQVQRDQTLEMAHKIVSQSWQNDSDDGLFQKVEIQFSLAEVTNYHSAP